MTVRRARVSRAVAATEPHNYLKRDVAVGEVFYRCIEPAYGVVDTRSGVALTESPDGGYPFFEFPADAITWDESDGGEQS